MLSPRAHIDNMEVILLGTVFLNASTLSLTRLQFIRIYLTHGRCQYTMPALLQCTLHHRLQSRLNYRKI